MMHSSNMSGIYWAVFSGQCKWQYSMTKPVKCNSPPVIIEWPVTEPLSVLRPTTLDDVAAILEKSAAKQCQLYPVPKWFVKHACEAIAPVISSMCNASNSRKLPVRNEKAIVPTSAQLPSIYHNYLSNNYMSSEKE